MQQSYLTLYHISPAERFAVRLLASLWLSEWEAELQLSGLTPVQPAASLDSEGGLSLL